MAASAVRVASGAVLIDVVVSPGAKESEIRGVDTWRHALRVHVAAPARGGEANAELLRLLASRLRVHASVISLSSGARSRTKTIAVSGLDEATLRRRLGAEVA